MATPFHPKVDCVMRVTSAMNGEATFVRAPSHMTSRSSTFVNPRFKSFAQMAYVLVTFRVSEKMRMLVRVELLEGDSWRTRALAWEASSPNAIPTPAARPTPPPTPTPVMPKTNAGWIDDVYFTNDAMEIFAAAVKMSRSGSPVNVLMVGPSGYGKTTLPRAFAKQEGMKYLRVNCAAVRDPEEWFGYREAVDGSTVFIPTEFTTAVREGNSIVVMDEFNRVEPWLHNTLYPLLDDSRRTVVHETEIVCGSNLVFVATINDGAQFTGTFALDAAIVNRMDAVLPVDQLPAFIEVDLLQKRTGLANDTASKLVSMMGKLRAMVNTQDLSVDASTRSSLKIARLINSGMRPRKAVEFAFLNAIPWEVAKNAIDIVSTFFM